VIKIQQFHIGSAENRKLLRETMAFAKAEENPGGNSGDTPLRGIAMISAFGDELRRHRCAHRRARKKSMTAATQSQGLGRPDTGEMGNPLPVRLLRLKLAVETGDVKRGRFNQYA
jgi:hypothetical protein